MRLSFMTIGMCLLLISVPYGHASSVRQITMDEMIQQCQFVFEGKVLALEAKQNNQKRIHTYVTFEIYDIIKGSHNGNTITLSFLGGTIGDLTMVVGDMKIPQVGERGIYFVESLERAQVHPLYGWSQGHFLVKSDETGIDRVMTNSEQPVTRIMKDTSVDQINSNQETMPQFSNGVAKGVSLALENNDKGLTTEEFKKILREKMGSEQ